MRLALSAALLSLAALLAPAAHAALACLSECTPRIGIVSAFGQEAAILVSQTKKARTWTINGNRFTTGVLRGNPVVIVLSGVSIVNSTMVTQLMIDHFKVQRLVMSGIAGGTDPSHHVGDVIVPDRWAMPLEVFWSRDSAVPASCGKAGDVSCLGLKLAQVDGHGVPPYELAASGAQGARVPTGLFMRETFVMTAANAPAGEFRFDYPVDGPMLAVVRSIHPALERCGTPAADGQARCVQETPALHVGGRGVSGPVFLANAPYRTYLFEQLQAQAFEMETAALAHVAYANGIPYIAFRSLSDLAGADATDTDAITLFTSGLAERNEAAVTLAFLDAWRQRAAK